MRPNSTSPLAAVALVLSLAGSALAGDAIHPYTQQSFDEWAGKMKAAEDAVAAKSPPDVMMQALEASDAFAKERAQVLQRHPSHAAAMDRQLALRLMLVKLYANIGFLYAKTAAEKKNGALLTQPGGSFARLDQASALLATYAQAKGEGDPAAAKMADYVAQLRKQAGSVGEQLNAAGVAVAPASSTPVDKGTEAYFRQWWEKLAEVDKAMAAQDAAAAERAYSSAKQHQSGWNGWLKKHSAYAATLARQEALGAKLATGGLEGEIEGALALAKKGFEEKNDNYFSKSSGTHQKLQRARGQLAALAKSKGEADPDVARLGQALASAEQQVEQYGAKLRAAALASRELPVDVYSGSDKGAIKSAILSYWKERYPADKVLGVRFFETNWTRETNWKENATSIYKSDYSWLPVKVVVQTSGEVAALYPAFANKQHQSGDKMVISDDRGGAAYAVSEMLLKKVKF